ncbi:MAG: CPBP family intramembrane metalloprotease [Candidatus Obscuribacterales bacterium]|nr:CPBP family intramembrane metalloprotease [Candidatus Obscuribacterales bacterium]
MIELLKWPFWNGAESRLRGGWRLLLHFFVLIVITVLITPVGASVLSLFKGKALLKDAGFLLSAFLMFVCCTGSAFVGAKLFDRRRFSDFGLRLNKAWFIDLGFGFLLGALLMCAIFAAELALGWISVSGSFILTDAAVPFALSFVLAFLSFGLAAFAEEILCRGYQLKNLAEMFTCRYIKPQAAVVLAALVSSLLFSAGHLSNPNSSWISTVNLVAAGLVLTFAYVATGKLALPFGFHVAWNLFQGNVFGFPVSGMRIKPSLIQVQQLGDPLFTGGDFGPEAGVSGLVALAIGTVCVSVWARRRNGGGVLLNSEELTRFQR